MVTANERYRSYHEEVSDILLRDLPEDVVAAIDATAQRLGVSRNEYLRRELASLFTPRAKVTVEDLKRAAKVFADAKKSEIMAGAWNTDR
jgi:hypothetical protein